MTRNPLLGATVAAALAVGAVAPHTAQAAAVMRGQTPDQADRPTRDTVLSIGSGQLVTLPSPMADIFVADDKVADVQVRSPTQLWLFGRGAGETSIYATSRSGEILWSSQVRVGTNLNDVDRMLRVAMPDALVRATPMNGMVILTGTVLSPDDIAEATRLTQEFVGDKVKVLTKIRTATPLQVSLHVKIAEVSRNTVREIGVNLLNRDSSSGGFLFGIGQGNPGTITTITDTLDKATGGVKGDTSFNFLNKAGATTVGIGGRLLGMDLLASIDLAETRGLATTLAEPNLTALSGETASFLAGGEIPIPQSAGLGAVSVEFKQYGVSLAFTPVVLSDGRISLRVRPEVSQLSDSGAVKLNGFVIPALVTRRAETTVELGSGQSFMIGGLLQNSNNNTTSKAPFLGDLPVLGALFRSNAFRKEQTELVIVVTPYLVRPTNAKTIRLPTDGYRAASDTERFVTGQSVAADAARK